MYCAAADELHRVLLLCPRPLPRIATTPLPPTPRERSPPLPHRGRCDDSPPSVTPPRRLLESRRMSRSEGDLKKFAPPPQPLLRTAGSQQHLILLPPRNGMAQKVSFSVFFFYRSHTALLSRDEHGNNATRGGLRNGRKRTEAVECFT